MTDHIKRDRRALINVIHLADTSQERFRVRDVRLDSGDLFELSRSARTLLDRAGLTQVEMFASGGFDEWEIRDLHVWGAPASVVKVFSGTTKT